MGAEAGIVEREKDTRRWRDPVVAEVDDDPRVVRDAERLEPLAQRVGRQHLERKRIRVRRGRRGPRRREILQRNESGPRQVRLGVFGRLADVEQHEPGILEVLSEPTGRHQKVVALGGGGRSSEKRQSEGERQGGPRDHAL